MSIFASQRVGQPHHFDISSDRHGHWIARDRNGLVAGTFLTREGALRFARFEAGGDAAYVHEARIGVRRDRRS